MTSSRHISLSSLKIRILGGIFLIFSLAMGMVLYGVLTYQRDKLIDMTREKAMQTGMAVKAGLSSSMLQNDREASLQAIERMIHIENFFSISVLNKAGKVVMTSEPAFTGKVLDKNRDETCLVCHSEGSIKKRSTAYIEKDDESFLRTIIGIENEPACYGCHSSDQKLVGILLVDSSLASTNTLLHQMAQRIVLTGLFAFIVGTMFLSVIVTRFFTEPVEELKKGFEKVGSGDFGHWVEVSCGGEISDMADTFNVMSRAISRNVAEIKEKSNEMASLYTIVEKMSQTIEMQKLKEVVVDLLCVILHAECVTLVLHAERNKNIFEVVNKHKEDKRHYHTFYNTECDPFPCCALSREDLLDWVNNKYTASVLNDDKSKLLIPLHHKNMLLGLICVLKPVGETFTTSQRKMIPVLSHHITISFANAQLYDLAITDELTLLYTKRYFLSKLKEFEENFQATHKGFCVMMLDLDHFKEVNDTYGHPVGDEVLSQVGEFIRVSIRHGDIPCRYGGEEFVVLLAGRDINAASKIAERIRKKLEQFRFQIDEIQPFQKTVSIGLASCPLDSCVGLEVAAAADAALYQAKRAGRNQVVCSNNASTEL